MAQTGQGLPPPSTPLILDSKPASARHRVTERENGVVAPAEALPSLCTDQLVKGLFQAVILGAIEPRDVG